MSAALKKRFTTEVAVQDLWRVSETGDVEELTRMLPRVADVNVSNKHGMTALMRAAYHGHERIVRALLEHGADPNLVRNDRFTALSLAAFFGHTETVRILIEHGAKTEVVTRSGASAHTWATARTFKDAARCLESHAPAPVRLAPVAAPAPAPAPVAVKTLKDPPEIWDLVHEVPRGFKARSAFVSRLRSMNRALAVGVLTGLLLIVACGVGVLMLRGSQASNVQPEVQGAAKDERSAPPNVETVSTEAAVSQPEVRVSETPANAVSNHPRPVLPRQFKARYSDGPIVVNDPPPAVEPEKPATVATPQIEKPKPVDPPTKIRPAERLSPQLITPSQTAKPKGKVIQWP